MTNQIDIFNPVLENGKTAYWNRFYAGTLRRVEREKKVRQIERIKAQQQISILINNK